MNLFPLELSFLIPTREDMGSSVGAISQVPIESDKTITLHLDISMFHDVSDKSSSNTIHSEKGYQTISIQIKQIKLNQDKPKHEKPEYSKH